jgi:hypothetical protein
MKKSRIVNYHGRGPKKTAKIAAQIHAVGAHLANMGRPRPAWQIEGRLSPEVTVACQDSELIIMQVWLFWHSTNYAKYRAKFYAK